MKEADVLVTGHRGFIGRRLVAFLQSELPGVHIIEPQDRIPFDDLPLLRSFLKHYRPQTVFHLAADRDNSTDTTRGLLDALLQLESTARVVLAGSAAEYGKVPFDQLPVREEFSGEPLTPYGLAKAAQTRLATEYARRGVHVITARIFTIIGKGPPEHTLVGAFLSKLRAACAASGDRTVRVGELDLKRDFIDIDDVCQGLALLAHSGSSGEVYNVCSGYSVTLRSVLDEMVRVAGLVIEVVADSPLIAKNPVKDICGSTAKIRAATGWSARYRWNEAVARLFT
jgi:GDP-4-dehydro-6-deoxy-D-mannose reductase